MALSTLFSDVWERLIVWPPPETEPDKPIIEVRKKHKNDKNLTIAYRVSHQLRNVLRITRTLFYIQLVILILWLAQIFDDVYLAGILPLMLLTMYGKILESKCCSEDLNR